MIQPPHPLPDFFSFFFIDILLEPILRLGVTIKKNCYNKKGFSGHAEYKNFNI